jgi:hypothetical protein
MKRTKIKRVVPTETVTVKKQFYDNETKKNVTYDKLVKPISNSLRKQSLKKLGELRDDDNVYDTTEFHLRKVIYDTEVVKHSRYKSKKTKVEVDVYTDSTNHKLVRISELYYNYSTYEYLPKKSISVPIKDFKKMIRHLNDVL